MEVLSRRQAIIAALLLGVKQSLGQDKQSQSLILGNESYGGSILFINIEDSPKNPVYAFTIRYKGREARVTVEEVMDALGAKPIK